MTGTAAYGPEPADHWVAARHSDLLDGLGRYLDPDAGLRDIMLHADHTDVVGTLGSHLDTQAGLAAILLPSAETAPKSPHQTEIAAAIAAIDPAVRITLRRDPVILAVIFSDLTVRALTIVDKAPAARESDCARDFTLDLARALDRDLASDLHHARILARALAAALGPDLGRDHELAGALELARALARALDHVLGLASARVPTLARTRDLGRELGRDHVLGLASGAAGITARAHVLASARILARRTARMMSDALGIRQTEDLAAALMEGALDDFTRADLAHADLTGRDLPGIRWSDWGTTWPPGTDTDALRAQSREVADGSGIYVITDPGSDDKARHHAHT